jgi:hypothetical protein
MKLLLRVLSILSAVICFAQSVRPAGAQASSEPDPGIERLHFSCWVPAIPGIFDQPTIQLGFAVDGDRVVEVDAKLSGVWVEEKILTEKVIKHSRRVVNRLGKILPVSGTVIEEKIHTEHLHLVLMIPKSNDGVYFKDEQGENEPTSFDEEVQAPDLLVPGSLAATMKEDNQIFTDIWSLTCRIDKRYRNSAILKLEESDIATPSLIAEFFRYVWSFFQSPVIP